MRYRQRRRHAYPYADERACAARGPKRLEPLGYIQPVRAFRPSLAAKEEPRYVMYALQHLGDENIFHTENGTLEASFSAVSTPMCVCVCERERERE